MKWLSILRHAKAADAEKYAQDFERPLTPRGVRDTQLIAPVLARLDPPIQWLVASSAQRTRETAAELLGSLTLDRAAIYQDAVYNARAEDLLHVVAATPAEVDHLLLVGHNPGMQRTVAALCMGESDGNTTTGALQMPTCGLAHLVLDITHWEQVQWGCGTLQVLLRPKLLREG